MIDVVGHGLCGRCGCFIPAGDEIGDGSGGVGLQNGLVHLREGLVVDAPFRMKGVGLHVEGQKAGTQIRRAASGVVLAAVAGGAGAGDEFLFPRAVEIRAADEESGGVIHIEAGVALRIRFAVVKAGGVVHAHGGDGAATEAGVFERRIIRDLIGHVHDAIEAGTHAHRLCTSKAEIGEVVVIDGRVAIRGHVRHRFAKGIREAVEASPFEQRGWCLDLRVVGIGFGLGIRLPAEEKRLPADHTGMIDKFRHAVAEAEGGGKGRRVRLRRRRGIRRDDFFHDLILLEGGHLQRATAAGIGEVHARALLEVDDLHPHLLAGGQREAAEAVRAQSAHGDGEKAAADEHIEGIVQRAICLHRDGVWLRADVNDVQAIAAERRGVDTRHGTIHEARLAELIKPAGAVVLPGEAERGRCALRDIHRQRERGTAAGRERIAEEVLDADPEEAEPFHADAHIVRAALRDVNLRAGRKRMPHAWIERYQRHGEVARVGDVARGAQRSGWQRDLSAIARVVDHHVLREAELVRSGLRLDEAKPRVVRQLR